MSGGGTLVLLYHRVVDVQRDPHGLAVRPERFAQHCEILRKRCDVVPLRKATGSRRQVAITFDDGYADNAADARRILADAGLSATFFIAAGRVGEPREAWWDRLEQIMLESATRANTLEVEIEGRPLWLDIRSASARERAHLALFWRLRPMRPAAIGSVLGDLESQLGVRSSDRHAYRWMTIEELRALSKVDGIEIGAHTLTHPFLATLTSKEQWQEIDGCRRVLEEVMDTPADLFSYPYGSRDAIGAITTQLVREAGYTMACTATGGIARPGCDLFQIPRNAVGDWDAERFEQWLDHWLIEP
jgi:peptidoglycan/xylan/chitin deacetylase (PgdA/CDA1 family)